MTRLRALPALLLVAWTLSVIPAADAAREIVHCVRDGPPCGTGCVVGEDYDCVVTVFWYDCVTFPCFPEVCIRSGFICTDLP